MRWYIKIGLLVAIGFLLIVLCRMDALEKKVIQQGHDIATCLVFIDTHQKKNPKHIVSFW